MARRSTSQQDNRIRVAHVAARLPVGGMERIVENLVCGLPGDAFDSSVWCLEDPDILGRELISRGWPVSNLQRSRRRDLGLVRRIADLVRCQRPDVVHCHDELSWFYGTLGVKLGGFAKIVVTLHGRRGNMSRRHVIEQRLLASLASAVISVSHFLRDQAIAEGDMPSAKLRVIRNGVGVDTTPASAERRRRARFLLGLGDMDVVIGSVGELSAVKNLDLLIESALEASAAIPSLRVVLIGEGAERARLSDKVAALGASNLVSFAGCRRDVPDILPALDMYVCSSHYEGISLSILEAMAAERPVIATAVGGNPEIVQHGNTGWLVRRDDRTAMSNAIVELWRDGDKRRLLGRQARQYVRLGFSVDRMVRDYAELYRSLLARSAPRRGPVEVGRPVLSSETHL